MARATIVGIAMITMLGTAAPWVQAGFPGGLTSGPLISEIRTRLQKLMPPSTRISTVWLQCDPPDGARLQAVAPGLSRLTAPGFSVEFSSAKGAVICSARATLERQVLVAIHDLSAGEIVSAADFVPQWVDTSAAGYGAMTQIEGQPTLLAPIGAGQPVLSSLLQKTTLIRPGEMVNVTVRNGGVTLRTHLKAGGSGGEGDYVTLENPSSGKMVGAQVSGRDAAEIIIQSEAAQQ
ncbi:MAG: flagellar basal body P-ring formation chaperone FlgA [Candidatus Binataceae bacterium]